MQLRLKPTSSRNTASYNLIIKIILIFIVFFVTVFILDKIEFRKPTKIIKQEISNDKLITLK